jgi:acyl carrier protein
VKTSVEARIARIIEEMVSDWGVDVPDLGPDTFLAADLGFTSVDVVHLFVCLEREGDAELDFERLVMPDGSYVSDLSVAAIRDFVLEAEGTGAGRPS